MSESIVKSADRSIESVANGYLHPAYAESLSEFGAPRLLPRCRGWLLQRRIPVSVCYDGIGCYPLFACKDWSQLGADLEELNEKKLVSLSLVTDPFGEYDLAYLRDCFRDVVSPFKQHFVVDLNRPLNTFVHPHHRRYALKAFREVQVEECTKPENFLEDWATLYSTLVEKHNITGIGAFSRESFAKQFRVPGMVAFRAVRDGVTVGMLLWYEQDNRAYYHLGAYSPAGYELRASFALFKYSIEHFAQRGLSWLSLGGAAGAETGSESGLTRFKAGWATGARTAYFCGRILDRQRYDEIVKARNLPPTNYFPAYRFGEFR